MMQIKHKKTPQEMMDIVRESLEDAYSPNVRAYYRGMLEGLEYAIDYIRNPFEAEEMIEIETEIAND